MLEPVFVHALWNISTCGSRRERKPEMQRALLTKAERDLSARTRINADLLGVGFGAYCADLMRASGIGTVVEVADALPVSYGRIRKPDHWWHKLEAIRIAIEKTSKPAIWLDFDTRVIIQPDASLYTGIAKGPEFQGALRMHRRMKCPWMTDIRRQVEMFHGGCYYFRSLSVIQAALESHRKLQTDYPLYASDENAVTWMVDGIGERETFENVTLYRTLHQPGMSSFIEGNRVPRINRLAAVKMEASRLRFSRYEFPQLLDAMRLKTGVEVGVHLGEFSYHLLSSSAMTLLTSVDAWPGKNAQYRDGAESLLSEFGKRSRVLALSSAEAAKQIDHADFVYIDSSHRYPDVAADLRAWAPKVNQGGILAGHDYCDAGNGVMRAVNEFARATRRRLFLTREKWASWLFFM